ncbi:MAG: hypothetical protein K2Q18_17285, partial [Bdellovibrionales bacterium]|nr:hypothetical protein [Bdellovibrionales bacterium]
ADCNGRIEDLKALGSDKNFLHHTQELFLNFFIKKEIQLTFKNLSLLSAKQALLLQQNQQLHQ